MSHRVRTSMTLAAAALIVLSGCASGDQADDSPGLVIYSGRSEELVGPLLEQFETSTGIDAEVRYGDTAELAAQLLEEGDNSPADVFFAQDAGALQVVQDEGLATPLSRDLLDRVPAEYRSTDGQWVGASGRARVLVHNTEQVDAADVPDSVLDLTDPRWRGEVGIAPTNASFQAFVTAMRVTEGEDRARQWLEDLLANDVQKYQNNTAVVEAVDSGQISLGLVNHYYLYERADEVGADNLVAGNAAFAPGDPGNLVNVAGVAVLQKGADNPGASQFADFLLSDAAQQYFADETAEYPLVEGVAQRDGLPPLAQIEGPGLTLDQLADLRGTQDLLLQVGLI